MRRLVLGLAILVGASIAPVDLSHAANRVGGNGGGSPVDFTCNNGANDYIKGVEGFYGQWIDSFRLRCGRGGTSPSIGTHQTIRHTVVDCDRGYAVVSILVDTINFHGTQIIRNIGIYCRAVTVGAAHHFRPYYFADWFGLGGGSVYQQQQSNCQPTHAFGMRVRSGAYIDSIQLLCR